MGPLKYLGGFLFSLAGDNSYILKSKFLFSVFYVFKLSRPCSELTTNRERSYFEYQFFRQIIGKWFSKFSFTQVFIDSHVFFGIESWRWNSHQWIRNCYNSFCRYDETLVLTVFKNKLLTKVDARTNGMPWSWMPWSMST